MLAKTTSSMKWNEICLDMFLMYNEDKFNNIIPIIKNSMSIPFQKYTTY